MAIKCIVCNQGLETAEYAELADEFKSYPAHKECFDEFDDAEVFLDYARSTTSPKTYRKLIREPEPQL